MSSIVRKKRTDLLKWRAVEEKFSKQRGRLGSSVKSRYIVDRNVAGRLMVSTGTGKSFLRRKMASRIECHDGHSSSSAQPVKLVITVNRDVIAVVITVERSRQPVRVNKAVLASLPTPPCPRGKFQAWMFHLLWNRF